MLNDSADAYPRPGVRSKARSRLRAQAALHLSDSQVLGYLAALTALVSVKFRALALIPW